MSATHAVVTASQADERRLPVDLLHKALPLGAAVVVIAAIARGGAGAATACLAVGIVVVNLIGAALSLDWAARRSPAVLMATALGGFLGRMAIIVAVIGAVREHTWVDLPTLAVSVLATHLALLIWESRYVSASLAFPGLKPAAKELR